MSNVVSGQVSFGVSGNVIVGLGIPINSLETTSGARSSTVEINGLLSVGHADAGNQYVHATKDGRAEKDATRCIKEYDPSGTKVLEGKVASGWGTSLITFNITQPNANYSVDLIGRT